VPAPADRGVAWASVAVLLAYPDADLWDALPGIDGALVAAGAAPGAGALRRLVAELRSRPLLDAQQAYVATFDTKRRCCPYLTYYLHGDTRRRGLALWRVKAALRACGLEPAQGELPDHLSVLAELAAVGDESVAVALLTEHRAGLTLLRAALEQARSPYAAAVEALDALLPADGAAPAHAAATHLATAGPPTETVGLPGWTAPFVADPAEDRGARR
jgi:nitrate reductase delta subunit